MSIILLSLQYWIKRPLTTLLLLLLITTSVALLTSILIINRQSSDKLLNPSYKVDLIISAKGSPLQTTLSTLFLSGSPTGHISVGSVRNIVKNRAVRLAVPIIIGGQYRGFRIVGANQNYLEFFKAKIEKGRLWQAGMEVVLGAKAAKGLGLEIGDRFTPERETGDLLDGKDILFYDVTGILEKSGTVLDKAILTDFESFWGTDGLVDNIPDSLNSTASESYNIFPFDFPDNTQQEISSVLVLYRSPMAALTYPKYIERESELQAVVPGIEMLRLNATIRQITSYFNMIAFLFSVITLFAIFTQFTLLVNEKAEDFAILRVVGISQFKIAFQIIVIAIVIADIGAVTGIVAGHIVTQIVFRSLSFARMAGLTAWTFYSRELLIYFGTHFFVIIVAIYSSYRVSKFNILEILKSP